MDVLSLNRYPVLQHASLWHPKGGHYVYRQVIPSLAGRSIEADCQKWRWFYYHGQPECSNPPVSSNQRMKRQCCPAVFCVHRRLRSISLTGIWDGFGLILVQLTWFLVRVVLLRLRCWQDVAVHSTAQQGCEFFRN